MAIALRNKVVLITGASSGFGEDAAVLFAKEGATVLLSARRLEKLNDIVQRISQDGGKAEAFQLDIADARQCRQLVDDVLAKYGQIDILFNNAGVGRLNFLDQLDLEADILPQINTNFIGLIQLTRYVLPSMIARKQGHIINMSSVAGWIGPALYSIYAATKFGVRGFTEALRQEVAPFGIHVSGIYPGPASTEFGEHIGLTRTKRSVNVPKLFYMTSQFVAEQVVKVAKRPRSNTLLPWYFNVLTAINFMFPSLVDALVVRFFVRKQRSQLEDQN